MINVLLAFTGKITKRERRIMDKNDADWVGDLPEGHNKNDVHFCQLVCKNLNKFNDLKGKLEANDRVDDDTGRALPAASLQVIGVWYYDDAGNNDPGLPYGFKWNNKGTAIVANNDSPSPYPFDIALYTQMLNDIVENGVPRRPTQAEAKTIAVNKFAGWPDRMIV